MIPGPAFSLDSARVFHYHAACFGKRNSSGLGLRAIRIHELRQVRKKATVVDSRRCRGNTRGLASSGSFPDPQFTSPTSRLWFRFRGSEWIPIPRLIADRGIPARRLWRRMARRMSPAAGWLETGS